ncbi:hypothetical protein EW145_g7258 [Phellinidium pouzarii]|uniref:Uncharacterized protein n=1 Tax=Phellinidium pouzarii TaxID=167371 RepID=A0A4S4KLV8_9AGAM|nr:hypothetical protein EW145_g7258 [Phellinidium pouzarii]
MSSYINNATAMGSKPTFDPFNYKLDCELYPRPLGLGWPHPEPKLKTKIELKHPRPQRRPALMKALAHFEECLLASCSLQIAPTWTNEHRVSNHITAPICINEFMSNHKNATTKLRLRMNNPLGQAKCTALSNWQRAIKARVLVNDNHSGAQRLPASSGLACLSPGFLDHFPSRRSGWVEPPRPEDLPPPSFSLSKARLPRPQCLFPPPPPAVTQPKHQPAPAPPALPGLAYLFPGFYNTSGNAWPSAPRPEDLPKPSFSLATLRAQAAAAAAAASTSVPSSIPTIPSEKFRNVADDNKPAANNDNDDATDFSDIADRFAFVFDDENGDACERGYEDGEDGESEDDDAYLTADESDSSDLAGSVCSSSPVSPSSEAEHPLHLHWTVGMPGNAVTYILAAEQALQQQAKAKVGH